MSALIASLVIGQTQQPFVKAIEIPRAGADRVIVRSFVKSPEMTAIEQAAWYVLGESLLDGFEDYTKTNVARYGNQKGVAPLVDISEDFISVQFVLPADSGKIAAHMAVNCVKSPNLRDDTITEAKRRILRRSQTAFQQALDPRDLPISDVTPIVVRSLHQRAFTPENCLFIAAGEMEAGSMSSTIQSWCRLWRPERTRPIGRINTVNYRRTNFSDVTSLELQSDPITPSTPFSAARILATVALGSGKGSTMWRVLRQEHGLAYELDGMLWPTKNGWKPRFIMVKHKSDKDLESLAMMRELMLKDIEEWDESVLLRAIAVAQTSLNREYRFSPFWLSSRGAMSRSLEDEAAWQGFLEMTGSGMISINTWSEALGNVNLSALKSQAKKMIEEADQIYVPG